MSSQMSGDYNCWVQLARFIQHGCEHSHNSIKTALLGLYDPALLKTSKLEKSIYSHASFFRSLINYVTCPWYDEQERQCSFYVSWTFKTITQMYGYTSGQVIRQT